MCLILSILTCPKYAAVIFHGKAGIIIILKSCKYSFFTVCSLERVMSNDHKEMAPVMLYSPDIFFLGVKEITPKNNGTCWDPRS